jgi:hypothetical protein
MLGIHVRNLYSCHHEHAQKARLSLEALRSPKSSLPRQARRQSRHIPQTSSYLHRVTSMLTVRISPSEEMMIRFATESAKGGRSLPTLREKRSMKTWNQNE